MKLLCFYLPYNSMIFLWRKYGDIHFLCPVRQALAPLYSDEHWQGTVSAT